MACPPWWISQLNQQNTSRIGSCACICSTGANLAQFFTTKENAPGKTIMKETSGENSVQLGARFVDAVGV